jgi:hypothetical protein
MIDQEKNAARLYEVSDELDFLIEAGDALAQKNPDMTYAGVCCILRDVKNKIKEVASSIEST